MSISEALQVSDWALSFTITTGEYLRLTRDACLLRWEIARLSWDTSTDSDYRSLILSDKLTSNIASSLSQCAPECHDCVFESHCGADPVYHHATHGDPLGIKPLSGFCQRQKGVMATILDLLDNSPEDAAVLRSWGRM